MNLTRKLIITFLLFSTFQGFAAPNLRFLNESAPVFHFTEVDFDILVKTIQKALNEKKDGEKLAWENKDTGHAGLVNPLNTTIEKGVSCRMLRLINRAGKRISQTQYKFCKQPDGIWKVSN